MTFGMAFKSAARGVARLSWCRIALPLVLLLPWSGIAQARVRNCTEIVVSAGGASVSGPAAGAGESIASRSIAAAMAKLRQIRAAHPAEHVCLSFRAGTYDVTSPIRIGLAESGGPGAATVLQPYDAGPVTISGGVRLRTLKGSTRDRWLFDIAGVCRDLRPRSLFVDGQRRMRARFPAKGFLTIAGEVPRRLDRGVRVDAFRYDQAAIPDALAVNDASEVIAYHYWSMSRLNVRSMDRGQGMITLNGMASHPDVWARFGKGEKFYLENVDVAGGLQPGEWLQTGSRIAYRPTGQEATRDATVVLPCTERLLEMTDGAHDITVEGLRFAYSGRGRDGYRITPAQAGIGPDTSAAIELRSASHVAMTHIDVSGTADLAILLNRGTRRATIANSTFRDLGAGAVAVGEPAGAYTRSTQSEDINAGNDIAHNTIRDGGRIRQDAVAIWVGDVGGNRVTGNRISNFAYTGISVGWNWGGMKISRNNLIEGNVIDNIGYGGLSDLGGIYTLADLNGTVIRNNSISHISAARYGGFGMYLDRGSSGMIVEGNRISDVKNAGIALHISSGNVIKANSICVTGVPSIYVIKPGSAPNVVADNDCRN
ncbi:MAG: hypothetical protein GC182_13240 [Rhodopseudomonas sp.]|nr:hypothetical protein [Rhodopseudomonas sp.]